MQRLLTTILIFLPLTLLAQVYSVTDRKAIRLFEEGRMKAAEGNFSEAVSLVENAQQRQPSFMEAYILLGEVYMNMKQDEDALAQFRKGLQIQPNSYPPLHFNIGYIEISRGNYAEAEKAFEAFLSFPDRSRLSPKMVREAQQGLNNCRFAPTALANPVPFEPKNLGPTVNSAQPEYYPCLTADGSLLLYTRELQDPRGYEGRNEDFFVSESRNGKWQQSRNVGQPVNTALNEGAPTLSQDGQLLIFTACELFGDYGNGRTGGGSCDLFAARKVGNRWGRARNLGRAINSGHWESQPSWSADGRTLYFIRGFGRVNKQQDIYRARLNDNGTWGKAEKLSDVINTPGREESVFIHPDGRTLYFASDGHPGMGGLDLFMSKLGPDGEWTKPVNLGYPINTFNDENSLLVNAEGDLAYFASDREGGYGQLDLYSFELPESVRPDLVTYMKGTVRDIETKKPLAARFELIDLETGKPVVTAFSNKGNGEFLVSVPTNRNYALNVSKNEYLFYTESFLLKEETPGEPVEKDVDLTPIRVDGVVILKNIFFDTDKFDLKSESMVELQKLLDLLVKNPGLQIEIGGHTDNVGDEHSNQTLSENRAKSVFDYLIQQGIDESRLSYAGYGESDPIDTNDTPEGRANNRRTQFRVTGLE